MVCSALEVLCDEDVMMAILSSDNMEARLALYAMLERMDY